MGQVVFVKLVYDDQLMSLGRSSILYYETKEKLEPEFYLQYSNPSLINSQNVILEAN